eukprot:m.31233 g.31233  ORF g.31233 m.31233 type:complete len:699 (-) comp9695_c0_seq1:63-2159(-)
MATAADDVAAAVSSSLSNNKTMAGSRPTRVGLFSDEALPLLCGVSVAGLTAEEGAITCVGDSAAATPQSPMAYDLSYEEQMETLRRQLERLETVPGRRERGGDEAELQQQRSEDNHDLSAEEGDSEDSEDTEDTETKGNTATDAADAADPADPADASAARADGGNGQLAFHNADGAWLTLYRAVLPTVALPRTEAALRRAAAEIEGLRSERHAGRWAVLLLNGGHFAGAVFDGDALQEHKCFHRYVVRAKRGTVQSVADKRSGTIKSAGASMRRYNEAQLKADIQGLLATWHPQLVTCSRIFLQAPVQARSVFYTSSAGALTKNDPRLRRVPFPTKRPTLKECIRIHTLLSSILVYPEAPPVQDVDGLPDNGGGVEAVTNTNDLASSSEPKRGQDQEEQQDPVSPTAFCNSELYKASQHGRLSPVAKLLSVLGRDADDDDAGLNDTALTAPTTPDDAFMDPTAHMHTVNYGWNDNAETALHAAARSGCSEAVEALLEAGCNPALKNLQNKPPYAVAKDRSTRDAFRRFFGRQPDRYDYQAAAIPSPLTDELAARQQEQQLEREAKAKARKRARAKAKRKAQREREQKQQHEEQEIAEAEAERQEPAGPSAIGSTKGAPWKVPKGRKPPPPTSASARELRAQAALARLGGGAAGSAAPRTTPPEDTCDTCGKPMPKGSLVFRRFDKQFCSSACARAAAS